MTLDAERRKIVNGYMEKGSNPYFRSKPSPSSTAMRVFPIERQSLFRTWSRISSRWPGAFTASKRARLEKTLAATGEDRRIIVLSRGYFASPGRAEGRRLWFGHCGTLH